MTTDSPVWRSTASSLPASATNAMSPVSATVRDSARDPSEDNMPSLAEGGSTMPDESSNTMGGLV